MAMTSAGAINAALIRHELDLRAVQRQVVGDVSALDGAGAVESGCATRVKGAGGEMTTARAALAKSWAAPSGEAFQTRSERLPDGIAVAERLFAALGTGLSQLGLVLNQTQDQVGSLGREFGTWASEMRSLLSTSPLHPDVVLQRVDRTGESYVDAARAAAQRFDQALEQFSLATAPIVRELAAAQPVTP